MSIKAEALFLGGVSLDLVKNCEKKGSEKLLFSSSIGGSITNSTIIAAKLGLKTALLTKISKDSLGREAINFLESCEIDTRGVILNSNIKMPLAIAEINKSGIAKYTFYKNPPKDSVVPIKNISKALLNNCKVFHTGSSYSYQKETFKETLKFVKYLKKRNVFIFYDPNIRPESIVNKPNVKNRVLQLLNMVDLAKLSEIDLEYLTSYKNPEKGLRELKKLVNCELILTLGAKGAVYMNRCHAPNEKVPGTVHFIKIPAFKVKVADTIGAGDAFIAGLIYKLIKEGRVKFFVDIKLNMTFASAISAIICTKKGGHEGLKDLKQVNSFIAKHVSKP